MVVQAGLSKVALYRDADGRLHKRSGVCPHLGCAVEWNPSDKTFDCVCHGAPMCVYVCVSAWCAVGWKSLIKRSGCACNGAPARCVVKRLGVVLSDETIGFVFHGACACVLA